MADPGAPGLRLRVARLAWGEESLFDDLTIEFPAGRWTCLLGASGCGKTTMLRLAAGLLPGGVATASDGLPLSGRIAYMAQSDMLLPWLDVRENLIVGWRLRRSDRTTLREKRAMADRLLGRVGLAGLGDAAPATLSGGMRQRAALARTIMEDRPVVLMDEPFSALDAITRHRLQDLAAELLVGRTVVLVTHSPQEALRLGHEVRILGGLPVVPGAPIRLHGSPPRDAGDPSVLALQARLLRELAGSSAPLELEACA